MKSRADTHLYGLMRCLSTCQPAGDGKYTEYLPATTFSANKELIQEICGIKTEKTLKAHLRKLIDGGLVEEGQYSGGKCYYFPYDYNGLYKIITKDLLYFLVNTGNGLTLKIYFYLLNKIDFKENYSFTSAEIVAALGHSTTDKRWTKAVSDALEALKKLEVISYEETYQHIITPQGEDKVFPVKILKNVSIEKPF